MPAMPSSETQSRVGLLTPPAEKLPPWLRRTNVWRGITSPTRGAKPTKKRVRHAQRRRGNRRDQALAQTGVGGALAKKRSPVLEQRYQQVQPSLRRVLRDFQSL